MGLVLPQLRRTFSFGCRMISWGTSKSASYSMQSNSIRAATSPTRWDGSSSAVMGGEKIEHSWESFRQARAI